MRISVEKDGYKFVIILLLSGLVFLFIFWPAAALILVLTAVTALFFRESRRNIQAGDSDIVAPASGRIIAVKEAIEEEFIKGRAMQISIFMSLLNEHINYAPVSGKIIYLHHRSGGFKKAYREEASLENEAQFIGFQRGGVKILMKQVAGIIARRIICRCRLGETIQAGQKLGLIRFGSRVEIFLPLSAQLSVSLGEKVRGGVTLLGKLP